MPLNGRNARVIDDCKERISVITGHGQRIFPLAHKRRHVDHLRKGNGGGNLHARTRIEAFQLESDHHRQRLDGQLLGAVLLRAADLAHDLLVAAQVLRFGEALQTVQQGAGGAAPFRHRAQIQRKVPRGVRGRRDSIATLANHVALQPPGEDLVDYAQAIAGVVVVHRLDLVQGVLRVLQVVFVQQIQRGHEELVGIMLLMAA